MALKYIPAAQLLGSFEKIDSMSISPDGFLLAAGGTGHKLLIFDISQTTLIYDIVATGPVLASEWVKLTNQLICGVGSGLIFSVSFLQNKLKFFGFTAHAGPVDCLSSISDSQETRVYLASSGQGAVYVWIYEVKTNTWSTGPIVPNPLPTAHSTGMPVLATALHWFKSVDDLTLVVSYKHHGVVGWKWVPSARVFQIKWCIPIPTCIQSSASPDCKYIVVSNGTHGFDLYSVETGGQERQYHVPSGVSSLELPVAFLHDGLAVAGGSSAGTVRVWATHEGVRMQTLKHEGETKMILGHFDEDLDVFTVACAIVDSAGRWSIHIWRTTPIRE